MQPVTFALSFLLVAALAQDPPTPPTPPAPSAKPAVAPAGATLTGSVTFDGKRPEPRPLPWRLRWAWTWAVWILLAVASPLVTAVVLVWLRGLGSLDRIIPE